MLSTLQEIGVDAGGPAPSSFQLEDQGVQLAPVAGYLSLHISILDTTAPSHTCHMTISAVPEKLTTVLALKHSGAPTTTSTARIFGNQ
jgi:hypothetical protein